VRGDMYRGQPFQGDLEKCHKQKEIMDLSDLATSPSRRLNQRYGDITTATNRAGRYGMISNTDPKVVFWSP
jgi:hypothetical protein